MQDGCSGSQRLLRLQTRVREEIQLVAELPNVKETPHGLYPSLPSRSQPRKRYTLVARRFPIALAFFQIALANLVYKNEHFTGTLFLGPTITDQFISSIITFISTLLIIILINLFGLMSY